MSTFMPMLYSAWDSDIAYSFRKSRVAVISTLLLLKQYVPNRLRRTRLNIQHVRTPNRTIR